MEEKKLTDEDIVKALKVMGKETVAFAYDKEQRRFKYVTAKEILDLIHCLQGEKVELQKKVDKLKAENIELYKEHTVLIAGSILAKQNIAKDTAKDIYDKCVAIDKATGCKGFVCIEAIAELSKGKGMEVE